MFCESTPFLPLGGGLAFDHIPLPRLFTVTRDFTTGRVSTEGVQTNKIIFPDNIEVSEFARPEPFEESESEDTSEPSDTEYQRLGGKLPAEIEAMVKVYSMPRLMKPPHTEVMKGFFRYCKRFHKEMCKDIWKYDNENKSWKEYWAEYKCEWWDLPQEGLSNDGVQEYMNCFGMARSYDAQPRPGLRYCCMHRDYNLPWLLGTAYGPRPIPLW